MDKLFRLKNFFRSGRLRLTPMLLRDLNDYIEKHFYVECDRRYEGEDDKRACARLKETQEPVYPNPSENGGAGKTKESSEKKESPRPSSAQTDGIVKDAGFPSHKGATKFYQEEAPQKKENQDKQTAEKPQTDETRRQTFYQSAQPSKEEPDEPERKPKGGAVYYQSAKPELKKEAPAPEEHICASMRFDELPDRKPRIDEFIRQRQQPKFSMLLLSLIDRRGEKDSDVYHRAQLDRRVFSKIRSDKDYHPSRDTVVALALALKLKRSDADELLESAGYALSRSRMSDLTIAFCIEREIFDVNDVNSLLDYYDLPILGKYA